MPRRFVVIDDTLQSATIDGHSLIEQTRTHAKRLAHEYRFHERLHATMVTVKTHMPRESYVLLALALGVFLLQRALVALCAWRVVRRHAKVE